MVRNKDLKDTLELEICIKKSLSKYARGWYIKHSQAKAICNYKLGKHAIGTKTNSYKYGWYDGSRQVDKGIINI